MGQVIGPWWTKHRTFVFAIVLTAGLAMAVQLGHFTAARSVFPLAVVWALAFHSLDSRRLVERMELAAEDVRQARTDYHAGDVPAAVEDALAAGGECQAIAEETSQGVVRG